MNSIRITESDNVAVALHPIAAGEAVDAVGGALKASEDIPQGHKVALTPIEEGEAVIKYGFPIGHATESITAGRWVHTHNVKTNLSGEVEYSYHPCITWPEKAEPENFMGFRRDDGRAAIRNEIWIIPTVGCVNDIAKKMVDAGAVLVLSLGCENLTHEQFLKELGPYDEQRVKFLTCQEVEDEFSAGRKLLEELAAYAGKFSREPVPVSELVVGMKCGGSDGLSGITANPTVGRFSDMLTARGGSTVLTEVPEMFGAEGFLMDRCVNEEVFHKAEKMLNGFKDYFIRHGEVVYDNPSPGNKQGGITTLEDKSCGCVQKGGTAPIADVIGYGDPVVTKGLNMLYGPGNDLVSATAMTASGAHLILFTTGRGTPFGAPAPTLKIATNSQLAQKKSGWIDFNAGSIVDGETIQEAAQRLLELVIETAGGKKTKAEERGFREISIFKDGVVL